MISNYWGKIQQEINCSGLVHFLTRFQALEFLIVLCDSLYCCVNNLFSLFPYACSNWFDWLLLLSIILKCTCILQLPNKLVHPHRRFVFIYFHSVLKILMFFFMVTLYFTWWTRNEKCIPPKVSLCRKDRPLELLGFQTFKICKLHDWSHKSWFESQFIDVHVITLLVIFLISLWIYLKIAKWNTEDNHLHFYWFSFPHFYLREINYFASNCLFWSPSLVLLCWLVMPIHLHPIQLEGKCLYMCM